MSMMVGSSVLLVVELVLLVLALKTWATIVRAELPRWRNTLSFAALLLLSLNWCGAVVLAVQLLVRQDASGVAALTEVMLTVSRPLAVAGVILAVALRRAPRIEAPVAGLLMYLGLPLGYV